MSLPRTNCPWISRATASGFPNSAPRMENAPALNATHWTPLSGVRLFIRHMDRCSRASPPAVTVSRIEAGGVSRRQADISTLMNRAIGAVSIRAKGRHDAQNRPVVVLVHWMVRQIMGAPR